MFAPAYVLLGCVVATAASVAGNAADGRDVGGASVGPAAATDAATPHISNIFGIHVPTMKSSRSLLLHLHSRISPAHRYETNVLSIAHDRKTSRAINPSAMNARLVTSFLRHHEFVLTRRLFMLASLT
jgi:hypothetical protein